MDIKSEKIKEEPQCNDFAVSIANIKYEKDYELFTDDVKTERDVDIENQINKILGTTVKEELDDEMLETDIFKEIPEVKDEPSSDDEAEHSLPGIKSEEVMLKSESEADDSERGDGHLIDDAVSMGHGSSTDIYSCDHCHYKTYHSDRLSNHKMIRHDKNPHKKYNCHLCDFKTYCDDYLKKHVLSKHDTNSITKFGCHLCDFRTYYKSYLKTHMITHHDDGAINKFVCNLCDFRTHHNSCLKFHMITQHDDGATKKIRCHLCDFTTHRNDRLKSHIIIKHEF